MGKDAPKYTFGEKHSPIDGDNNPGPGTYDA
jgi:Sperm-tail PG-rich repeat